VSLMSGPIAFGSFFFESKRLLKKNLVQWDTMNKAIIPTMPTAKYFAVSSLLTSRKALAATLAAFALAAAAAEAEAAGEVVTVAFGMIIEKQSC
jgi:hypothetical protein